MQELEKFAAIIPLPLYVTLGSFAEELFPPIPTPLIMSLAGVLVHTRNEPFLYLILLAIFGSVGRTCGAILLYMLADKAEDFMRKHILPLFHISHSNLEKFGAIAHRHNRDIVVLTILRSIPIIPSQILSIGSGLIKMNFKNYIIGTFLGSIIRNFIFLIVGYVGIQNLTSVTQNAGVLQIFGFIGLVALGLIAIYVVYYLRNKFHH